eukprot:1246752-Alexandrium_andersonii.AAC.1
MVCAAEDQAPPWRWPSPQALGANLCWLTAVVPLFGFDFPDEEAQHMAHLVHLDRSATWPGWVNGAPTRLSSAHASLVTMRVRQALRHIAAPSKGTGKICF